MQGPFYKLISKDGIVQENFVNIPQNDLIEFSNQPCLRIMLCGMPRSGKTTLAKNLAQRLDVVHVNIENWILALLDKIKNYEPPEDIEIPEDLPEGEEPPMPEWLTPLEKSVDEKLKNGSGPDQAETIAILKEMVLSPLAQTKGYVIDLTFFKATEAWAKLIKKHFILGEVATGSQPIEFSHIIDLEMEDEEVRERASHMRLNPVDGRVYSRWEITERNKPKPKQYDENGDEIEEEEE
jgi:hypothetical protein